MPQNPSAFPVSIGQMGDFNEGMTLRDYFAAKAMPFMIEAFGQTSGIYQQTAEMCYKVADAMLEEREK